MSKVDLYPHNQTAYLKIKQAIENGDTKMAIAHATGTGKSYISARLFEDYKDDQKLVLVPTNFLYQNHKGLFDEYGIQNTNVMTYQSLIKKDSEEIDRMDYKVVVLDEYHHSTAKKWGESVRELIKLHPETIFLGTSATPVRTDGVNTIDEMFDSNCVSELPVSKAIALGILPIPRYVAVAYAWDKRFADLEKKINNSSNSKEEKIEYIEKLNIMRQHINKSYGMPIILNKYIEKDTGKYIVFCRNKKHLEESKETVAKWFHQAGFRKVNTYVVHSKNEEKDKQFNDFCNDNRDNIKLLFCINMLSEGLHLKGISGVILLRTTKSYIVFQQQIGRALEANDNNIPLIIDAVNNYALVQDARKLFNDIKEEISKNRYTLKNSRAIDVESFLVVEHIESAIQLFSKIEQNFYHRKSVEEDIKYLSKYKEKYGDLFVPYNYVCDDGYKLGDRCVELRKMNNGDKYGNRYKIGLTEKEIESLNKIGFIWDKIDTKWNQNFSLVKEYCDLNTITINEITYGIIYKNIKIGAWVHNQLHNIRIGKFDQSYKKKLLIEYGLEIDRESYLWLKRYEELIGFLKDNNKQCSELKKDDRSKSGYDIYAFSLQCRKNFKNNKLSKKQIDLLKIINFDFEFEKDKKNAKFEQFVQDYVNEPENKKHREKYYSIRKKYLNKQLSNFEIDTMKKFNLIDSYGIIYSLSDPYVAVYKDGIFTNHLYSSCKELERKSYEDFGKKIKSNSASAFCFGNYPYNTLHGFQFKYVYSRQDIENGIAKPTATEKELNYLQYVDYLSKRFPDKISKKDKFQGISMGNWLCSQRKLFKRGELSDKRIELFKINGIYEYLTK